MGNTIVTPSIIAKEALMQLKNNLVMGKLVHREYKNEFVKVGSTVSIRKPVKFVAKDGETRVNQDISESTVAFVINKRKHVSWEFSTQELTLSIKEYSKNYIEPACIALANIVDSDLCGLYTGIHMANGTAGSTPNTYKELAGGALEMNLHAVPAERRRFVVDPVAHLEAADVLKSLYNPEMVKEAVRGQKVGVIAGQDTYMDQNIKYHTAGTNSGDTAYQADDVTAQTGNTITVNTGSGTFVVGDVVTFAGCNSVNPISKVTTGRLMKFTVTAAMASGGTSLSISPAVVDSGAYQNVSNGIANDSSIVIAASHRANLAFHRNAFGLVMCPIEMPDGAAWKARQTFDDISIRVVKDYDINTDKDIIRLDILYGIKDIYPDLAARVYG